MTPAALILFGMIAVVLFAAGHLLARRSRSVSASIAGGRPDSMQSLTDAAATVNRIAREERMALAVVAARSGDAIAWFARSIASVVQVWNKTGNDHFESASRGDGDLQSLYIRKQDIDNYLGWARTVQ